MWCYEYEWWCVLRVMWCEAKWGTTTSEIGVSFHKIPLKSFGLQRDFVINFILKCYPWKQTVSSRGLTQWSANVIRPLNRWHSSCSTRPALQASRYAWVPIQRIFSGWFSSSLPPYFFARTPSMWGVRKGVESYVMEKETRWYIVIVRWPGVWSTVFSTWLGEYFVKQSNLLHVSHSHAQPLGLHRVASLLCFSTDVSLWNRPANNQQ